MMSDRVVYRKVPLAQRLCSYYLCNKQIERNIARTKDGRLWHWGCLSDARDEQYRCRGCSGTFDATEAMIEEKQKFVGDSQKTLFSLSCPYCGAEVSKHKQFLEEENLAVL
jgi:DNA-directed RNA polymerase subunit RPC12/RpoP